MGDKKNEITDILNLVNYMIQYAWYQSRIHEGFQVLELIEVLTLSRFFFLFLADEMVKIIKLPALERRMYRDIVPEKVSLPQQFI